MFRALFHRLLLFITAPGKAWVMIIREKKKEEDVRKDYIFPMMGLVALASFLGSFFASGLQEAVRDSCVSFVSFFAGYFMAAFFLNEVMERFDLPRNLPRTQTFVGYASGLMYAISIILALNIVPEFFFLPIFYLYTVYIIWESVGIYYSVIEEKKVTFVAVASLLIMISPFIIRTVLHVLMPK